MKKRDVLMRYILREELVRLYHKEKDPTIKERILAVIHRYDGKPIKEIANIIARHKNTVSSYLKMWNKNGYKGLIPRFTGSPKPRMSSDKRARDEDKRCSYI
ncbi:MAG: helix-turn-helix domain-containing protein [Brevinematia bacterium]